MNDGEILVFRDANIFKYHALGDYNDFKQICMDLLDKCGFDFFIPRDELDICFVKNHVKTNVIVELGENHPFVYEYPLCIANLMIIRKSNITMELMKEWLLHCENEKYIDGEVYCVNHHEFKWHTPEQGILSVILANWVRKRTHNIPLNYPNIHLQHRNINNVVVVEDKDCSYMKYMYD
jgi:hypothetical protein